jgi:hypothetical protein
MSTVDTPVPQHVVERAAGLEPLDLLRIEALAAAVSAEETGPLMGGTRGPIAASDPNLFRMATLGADMNGRYGGLGS